MGRYAVRRKYGPKVQWKIRLKCTKTQLRTCLCCGNEFPSIGPGNRICEECKKSSREDHVLGHPEMPT